MGIIESINEYSREIILISIGLTIAVMMTFDKVIVFNYNLKWWIIAILGYSLIVFNSNYEMKKQKPIKESEKKHKSEVEEDELGKYT